MGLHIKLRPHERLILNGCVIRNGDRATNIEIENRADILRGSEILSAGDCDTPVAQIQSAMQLALVSRQDRDKLLPVIEKGLSEIATAISGYSKEIDEARAFARTGEFYRAYKRLAPVAERESLLLGRLTSKGEYAA